MNFDYKAPINIAIVFENSTSRFWTTNAATPNYFVMSIPNSWFFGLNCFFKKEVTFNQSFLVEHSIIDASSYSTASSFFQSFFENKQFIYYYIYYFYHLKLKLNVVITPDFFDKVFSAETLYTNANWLERESAEMYGVYFLNKKDHRKLLLDYSKIDSPMLKDFGTEGVADFFYNFFEEQVCFVQSEIVEL